MKFSDAVKTCFKKYADPTGRASRSEFWYWFLFTFILLFIGNIVDVALLHKTIGAPKPPRPQDLISLTLVFQLVMLLPTIFVTARRLHDTNNSGWWMFAWLTFIGIPFLLYEYCVKGTAGPNKYGPDPLAKSN